MLPGVPSHASHFDTVINSTAQTLFFWESDPSSHGVSSLFCQLPYPLVTTIRYHMVLDSNYHRVYGTCTTPLIDS